VFSVNPRRPAGIGRNVRGGHAVPWAAEARVGGDHEAREPHIGANIEIKVSEGLQTLRRGTRLRPREHSDDEADADSGHR
jgi:hypothetical protein